MSTKKQLLDPIGSMCKLIALNFRKPKTKIIIKDHVLLLNEPMKIKGMDFQGVGRWFRGDEKEDISELYYVIIRVIKWYLVPDTHEIKEQPIDNDNDSDSDSNSDNNNDSNNNNNGNNNNNNGSNDGDNYDETNSSQIQESQELIIMVNYLCDALSKLQETYESGLVILALQFFINIIQEALEGKFDQKLLEKRLPKFILKKEKEYENLIDYNKLKQLWKVKTLKTICELYNNCFKVEHDDDIQSKTKDAIIQGYLTSIVSTLDIMDKEFQVLISNSNKG